MGIKEGKNLVADLRKHVVLLVKVTQKIQARVSALLDNRRAQLLTHFSALKIPLSVKDPSQLRELTFFVERSDISEEVVRLQSHLLQSRELLTTRGKACTCDYLAEEMFRAFNILIRPRMWPYHTGSCKLNQKLIKFVNNSLTLNNPKHAESSLTAAS